MTPLPTTTKTNTMKQTSVEWLFEKLLRADKLETLAKLLSKSWYYGNWQWENPNERIMQMLMQDLGYYPFKSEDEMIQQTRVDEDLYKEAVEKVALRNPRITPVENHSVDFNKMIDHIGKVNEMVESKGCESETFKIRNSNKSQTAVEWLIEKQIDAGIGLPKEWREQAKAMEKEQINKACYDGYYKEDEKYTYEYYNETYGK